jgi:hypothetical protein
MKIHCRFGFTARRNELLENRVPRKMMNLPAYDVRSSVNQHNFLG